MRRFSVWTLAVAVVLPAAINDLAGNAHAQSEPDAFQTGITGSSPGGRLNPSTMMGIPEIRSLILTLAERAVSVDEAERALASGGYRLDELMRAGLARVEDGKAHLALNYVSADDQRLIASKAKGYGREVADAVLERRSEIDNAVASLAEADERRRAILFFLLGCVALDWDGLGYTVEAGYRAPATVEGPGFAYTPWMKENASDISRRGLYWGSHNRPLADYTFTTFGDHEAVPRVALPDLYFSLTSPFSTLQSEDGITAGRRLVGAYSGTMLSDIARVILAIDEGAATTPAIEAATGLSTPTVSRILALLETIHYVEPNDAEAYSLHVTVLKDDAKPAAERVKQIARDAMESWHRERYADVRRALSELTALQRGVPFEVVYTEIWHYVFGYANLFLSESGLIANPYAEDSLFRGFLPFLWANAVDP